MMTARAHTYICRILLLLVSATSEFLPAFFGGWFCFYGPSLSERHKYHLHVHNNWGSLFFFILEINLVYRFIYLFYFIYFTYIHRNWICAYLPPKKKRKKETAPNFSFPFHLGIKARALRTASLIVIQGLSLASTWLLDRSTLFPSSNMYSRFLQLQYPHLSSYTCMPIPWPSLGLSNHCLPGRSSLSSSPPYSKV